MKYINYCLLFPRLLDVDLVKDPGAVAYWIGQQPGYRASIVGYRNEPLSNTRVNPVNITFLRRRYGSIIDGCLYLLRHYKRIDVLHLFQLKRFDTIVWAAVFKLLRRNQGIVYVKMDATVEAVESLLGIPTPISRLKSFFFKSWAYSCVTVASIETTQARSRLARVWPRFFKRCIYLPNGWFGASFCEGIARKKQVVTISRLGTYQKATDILLQAFLSIPPRRRYGWRLLLVGPIASSKSAEFRCITSLHPEVHFTGDISSRSVLSDILSESAIFCLCSRWESFGISIVEAARAGAMLVCTEVGAAVDVTHSVGHGFIVPPGDAPALALALQQAMAIFDSGTATARNTRTITHTFDYAHTIPRLARILRFLYITHQSPS
jgi:glycosyltransferase involved in cell wall biosynthesis